MADELAEAEQWFGVAFGATSGRERIWATMLLREYDRRADEIERLKAGREVEQQALRNALPLLVERDQLASRLANLRAALAYLRTEYADAFKVANAALAADVTVPPKAVSKRERARLEAD